MWEYGACMEVELNCFFNFFLFLFLVLVSRTVRYRITYVIKKINDAEIENNRRQKQSATLRASTNVTDTDMYFNEKSVD